MPRKKKARATENYADKQLKLALEKCEHVKKRSVLEHFILRSYQSDTVLIALMKKIIPDSPLVDNSTTHNYAQIKVIVDDRVRAIEADSKSTQLTDIETVTDDIKAGTDTTNNVDKRV